MLANTMERTSRKIAFKFYNGQENAIEVKRMTDFEVKSTRDRLFEGRSIDSPALVEELGPCVIDFSNVHGWSEDIPDIHPHSTRLFTIWGEDNETGKIAGIAHGFTLLVPFTTSRTSLAEYYSHRERVPYYPKAIIYSFRTAIQEREALDEFLSQLFETISANWREVRNKTITRLQPGSDLWKRFVFSFDQIIHFSFLCPSIDRAVIDTLKGKGYRITAVMQLLASSTPFYDQAAIDYHLRTAQQIIEEFEKDAQMREQKIS